MGAFKQPNRGKYRTVWNSTQNHIVSSSINIWPYAFPTVPKDGDNNKFVRIVEDIDANATAFIARWGVILRVFTGVISPGTPFIVLGHK